MRDLPPAPELTAAQRKKLRGQAMRLKPAVILGRSGVTDTVMDAVNAALEKDELIKLRIEAPDRTIRREWLMKVVNATHSALCGEVGHTASIYRPSTNKNGEKG